MKKILLVATLDPWADAIDIDKFSFLGTKAVLPPISLATIAALTLDNFKVDIWDEAIRGPIDAFAETGNLDLVGITGYTCHIPRAIEIAAMFRKRQIPVVIGGVGVSSDPERCRSHFDVLFIGEAELTWPQFMSDWQSNNYRKEYRQITKPDLALSPPPKWEIMADQMKNYLSGNVQTTRGCPFNCEFCDIIYLVGRKSRHKPIDIVLKEIATLERLGIKRVFFSDDNFIGSPRYTKELLQKLIPLNNSFETPLEFSTQLSMNVAHDEELLELLADANFGSLFIGIESIDQRSDHHMEFLRDLCDRTVNRLNLESEKQTPASNMPAGTMTMAKNRSSPEDILNIIEQKLRV